MPETSKNEAIIASLQAAGFRDIRLRVIPKVFVFDDGQQLSELEFSRRYFDDTPLSTIQTQMQEKILPTIHQHLGKRIYVTEHGIKIIPRTPGEGKITFSQKP